MIQQHPKLLLSLLFFALACAIPGNAQSAPFQMTTDVSKVVEGNNQFGFELYHNLRQKEGNHFFSPFSISSALSMTYAGARTGTAEEMATILHFLHSQEEQHLQSGQLYQYLNSLSGNENIDLSVANSIWPEQTLEIQKAFTQQLETHYGSAIFPTNFKQQPEESRKTINHWVEEKTQQKIKELITQGLIHPLTRLVLVNAIYFKGNWKKSFKEKNTRETPFWTTPETSKTVQMMNQTNSFRYAETEDFQLLEMPYEGKSTAMLVLLPKTKGGLHTIEGKLNGQQFKKWTNSMRFQQVQVFLPKFKLTEKYLLTDNLKEMGLKHPFSNAADFSGITGDKSLQIDFVIHKAFIEVNEKGTEAAASTAVGLKRKSASIPRPPVLFKADHPFLFFLVEKKTDSILFAGRLSSPTN